jgi:hypothetical protein
LYELDSKNQNPNDAASTKPASISQGPIDKKDAQFQAQLAALREANRLAYSRRSPWPFKQPRQPPQAMRRRLP